ncbi:MAG: alpha/beta hydrolase [Anaerolineae bacterium]|nr:alpha/beta hydrolase [Anaerolineae bacterium]
MEEIRVKVDDLELQIREGGQGEAIVFLHFSGANLMMWERVIPYFQDRYRLILVDLRGHGRSDRPETGYHVDDMARDVAEMMEQLELERAHIVGSSLGAEVGLALAAHYPEKVLSLVCDGALSSEYGPYSAWEGSEADFQEYVAGQLERMQSRPETLFPSVDAAVENSHQALEKYGYWNEYVEAMERYGAYRVDEGEYAKGVRKQAMIEYMGHYFQARFEDYYGRVKCPVLMVPGEDVLANEQEKAAMEGLAALAEHAEIAQVNGWDHPFGWLLDPEEVCKAVEKFLGDCAHTQQGGCAER